MFLNITPFTGMPNSPGAPYYLNNWRPLSLLNVDFKIATKALALRLKKVLPQVINNAQTGKSKADS